MAATRMIYEHPVEPPASAADPDAVREFTQRCTDVLEIARPAAILICGCGCTAAGACVEPSRDRPGYVLPIGTLAAAAVNYPRWPARTMRRASARCSTPWACRRSLGALPKNSTGAACCRSANSSAGHRARHPARAGLSCCSTRRPPRSTSPPKPALYRLLRERLPGTAIVSIGHRSTLAEFHERRLTLTRQGEGFTLNEAAAHALSPADAAPRAGDLNR